MAYSAADCCGGFVAGDCVLKKTKAVLAGGGETFTASGSVVVRPGFTTSMPWKVRGMACAALSLQLACPAICVPYNLRVLQSSTLCCRCCRCC
jgi:hypothetical protein